MLLLVVTGNMVANRAGRRRENIEEEPWFGTHYKVADDFTSGQIYFIYFKKPEGWLVGGAAGSRWVAIVESPSFFSAIQLSLKWKECGDYPNLLFA
jgi:hypothetical protein